MAKKCGCAAGSCSCLVVGQGAARVSGTGSASDPFVVSFDDSNIDLSGALAVTNSSTVELAKTGTGAAGDPIILTADVVVKSPDNTRWTLAIDNTGALSTLTASGSRPGAGSSAGASGGSGLRWYNGATWDARNTTDKVVWISLGFTAASTPPGYILGDVWLAEAS